MAFLDGTYSHPLYSGKGPQAEVAAAAAAAAGASCRHYTPDDVALLKVGR